jgi:hypothetical protein
VKLMYEKMFQLINETLSFIDKSQEFLELKKIEIRGIKIKLVYLDRKNMKVRVKLYEFDWFNEKMDFKREYEKDYTDKYFR